jgi:glycosyltransferase involved in cell wall biosynthesis
MLFIYIYLIINFKEWRQFKKLLPTFFVLLLFQDTIARNFSYHEILTKGINYLDELFVIFGISVIIYHRWRERNFQFERFYYILLTVFIIGLVSSIIHKVPLAIIAEGAFLMFKGFIIFVIFQHIPFSIHELQRYMKSLIGIGVFVLIFALIDFFMHKDFRALIHTDSKFDYRSGLISIQSLFIHPGQYGWFMAIISFYFLSFYAVSHSKRKGISAILFMVAAFLSLRFKVLLSIFFNGLIVSCKVFKTNYMNKKVLLIAASIFLVGGIFAGEEIYHLTILTIQRYLETSYTESARKALYIFGFIVALDFFPFGAGFGRYGGWVARENYSPLYHDYHLDRIYGLYPKDPKWATDTYWPFIMGELGFLGALLWLLIFVWIGLKLFRAYKSSNNTFRKGYMFFSLLVLFQSLIESTGEQVFNSSPQYVLIFAILGSAFALTLKKDEKEVSNLKKKVMVIGSSLEDKGGIVTVMKNINTSYIAEKYDITHVETYITGSTIKRLFYFLKGLIHFLLGLIIFQPDIIHIHMSYKGSFYRKSVFVILGKVLLGIPTVIHVHGSSFKDFYSSLSNMRKKYCRYILNKIDRLIVLSEDWKRYFSDIVNPVQILVLYNGVHTVQYSGYRQNDPLHALFLGRLGRRKGTYDLLDAVKLLKEHRVPFKLLLAGDGEIDEVKRIVKKEHLENYVEILGWINGSQKTDLLQNSDVLVLPSYNEGLPMAILEAMDYGMTVISTPVGGIPEVIKDGVNGFLVEPGDVKGLVEKFVHLAENPALSRTMGEKNQVKVKKEFDLTVILKDLELLYEELSTDKELGEQVG